LFVEYFSRNPTYTWPRFIAGVPKLRAGRWNRVISRQITTIFHQIGQHKINVIVGAHLQRNVAAILSKLAPQQAFAAIID